MESYVSQRESQIFGRAVLQRLRRGMAGCAMGTTPAQMLNEGFHLWGQFVYDYDELSLALREAGFQHPRAAQWRGPGRKAPSRTENSAGASERPALRRPRAAARRYRIAAGVGQGGADETCARG